MSEITAIMATRPATLDTAQGRTWWRCPGCLRVLAEIVGGRVVVKAGPRIISVRVETQPDQVCPRCQTVSVLTYAKMDITE